MPYGGSVLPLWEDPDPTVERKEIKKAIKKELTALDNYYRPLILPWDEVLSDKPSIVCQRLLSKPQTEDDRLEYDVIFRVYRKIRGSGRRLMYGCKNVTEEVKAREKPKGESYRGLKTEVRFWDGFYRAARVTMEQHSGFYKLGRTAMDEAKDCWEDVQQTLNKLVTVDLKLDHTRHIASLLFMNEERLADHCANALEDDRL
jgi:hypothetical protein